MLFRSVYSSFLQRAYDQILHDVCIQQLHVVFAIDRAGLVGSDGETHQGIFDISFLSSIPNMTICAPKNDIELKEMLKFAVRPLRWRRREVPRKAERERRCFRNRLIRKASWGTS